MNQREWISVVCTFTAMAVAGMIALLLLRALRGRSLTPLPPQRIRAVRWGAEIAFVAYAILFVGRYFVAGLFVEGSQVERFTQRLTISIAMLAVEVPLVLYIIGGLPYGAGPSWRRFVDHTSLGFLAWLVLTPITLGVHVVARHFMNSFGPGAAPEHAFIQLLQKNPEQTLIWLLVSMEAVFAAPIREELYFRGVLQPLAVRVPRSGFVLLACAAGLSLLLRDRAVGLVPWLMPTAFVIWVAAGLYAARYLQPSSPDGAAKRLFPPLQLPTGAVRGGLVGVAVLFGMFHVASWPDPVPLTVLGLGLGWLAIRTQGLTAPIVCHALFNAMALVQQYVMTRSIG